MNKEEYKEFAFGLQPGVTIRLSVLSVDHHHWELFLHWLGTPGHGCAGQTGNPQTFTHLNTIPPGILTTIFQVFSGWLDAKKATARNVSPILSVNYDFLLAASPPHVCDFMMLWLKEKSKEISTPLSTNAMTRRLLIQETALAGAEDRHKKM